jgi:two-component system, NarL family, invasion response regulator UvrY
MISIMLVDDHAVVRMGFRVLLEGAGDMRVVAECASGEEACRSFADTVADIVVLDLSMAGMGGLETIDRLLARHPDVRILVLSAHEDPSFPRRAMQAGARGYVTKRSAADVLIDAIRQVDQGHLFLEPALAQRMAVQQFSGAGNPADVLTAREFEVFLRLAQGRKANDIADSLFLSPRTVGTHLYNIKQKLNAATSAELALIAVRNGLLQP